MSCLMCTLAKKRPPVIFNATSTLYTMIKPLQPIRNIQYFSQNHFKEAEAMEVQQSGNIQRRQYSRITLKTKVTLIRMVCRKSIPFDVAIEQLGLKKTTALNIIKIYKETGSIPMRKFKKTRRNIREKSYIKKEEEQSIRQPLEIQMSPEESRNNQTIPSESPPYCYFNLIWLDCPIAFYCYY